MTNLPRGCADSHGYGISLNASPPTAPPTQTSSARQHGNESTKLDWFEFTNAECFLLSRQQSPGTRGSEHTLPKGSLLWASLNEQQPMHSSLYIRCLMRWKETTETMES